MAVSRSFWCFQTGFLKYNFLEISNCVFQFRPKWFFLMFHFPHNRACQFKLALKIIKEVKPIQVISGIKMNLIDNLTSHRTLTPSAFLPSFKLNLYPSQGWEQGWWQPRCRSCATLRQCPHRPSAEGVPRRGDSPRAHTAAPARGPAWRGSDKLLDLHRSSCYPGLSRSLVSVAL